MKKLLFLLIPFCSNAQKADTAFKVLSSQSGVINWSSPFRVDHISSVTPTRFYTQTSIVFLVIKDSIIYIDSLFANKKVVFKKLNK